MYQTLLAVLAITLATMFALKMQRDLIGMEMLMIRTEVGTQTTGVAVDRLEEISIFDFDEKTVGDSKVTGPAGLTSSANFLLDMPGNDIDDLHDSVIDTIRVYNADTLHFRVSTEITYADETQTDQPVAGPTKVKRATVRVYNLDLVRPDTIELSRSFLCDSRCAW